MEQGIVYCRAFLPDGSSFEYGFPMDESFVRLKKDSQLFPMLEVIKVDYTGQLEVFSS